jgi:hypothetical protein
MLARGGSRAINPGPTPIMSGLAEIAAKFANLSGAAGLTVRTKDVQRPRFLRNRSQCRTHFLLPCHAMTTVGVQMEQKQIRTRIALLAVATIFIVTVEGARAADECLEKPNAPSPQGSHWYYRTDRTTNRQCWYLGPERGKVASLARQDTDSARPSSKMSAPSAQTLVQATAAETATAEVIPEAAPVEITAGQGNTSEADSTVTPSESWVGIPPPPISSDRGSVSVRDSYAEEQSATAPEMGLTGSIVSSTEKAVRTLASSFFVQFCALLAVTLGLVAIIVRMIFTLSVRRPMPNQSESAQGQCSAASTDVPETFAHDSTLATVGYQVDAREADSAPQTVADAVIAPDTIIRISTAAAHETGMADSTDWVSSPPSDTVAGIESNLQHLLQELDQLRHEWACRGFEPTRKAVA